MTSRHIPKKIDENIKKASGFRCAWCGEYLTDRHHIYDYSLGGKHTEENLILLCPICHRLAGYNRISRNELFKRGKELTGKVDRSSGCLSINESNYYLNFGNNVFAGCKNFIILNDYPIISFEVINGYFMIFMKIYNKEGNLICWIAENRWWVDNESVFDFKFSKNEFIVIDKDNHEVLHLIINKNVIEVYGYLYLLGNYIQFSKDGMSINNQNGKSEFVSCVFMNIENFIQLKEVSFNKPIPCSYGIDIKEQD
jgi:hypothetical protein